jgi:phthiocerol/phenolphthiocerol synthesis type-I polyketide synthase D
LPTRRALEALERLLEEGAVQAGVMPIDWASWQRSYGSLAVAPYLSLLVSGSDFGMPDMIPDGVSHEQFSAAPPGIRREMLGDYLARQMARILKVPLASVELEISISNMGFDSLMSIELKNRLEADLKVSISMARLLQGPTLLELTDLVMNLFESVSPVEAPFATALAANEFEEGIL